MEMLVCRVAWMPYYRSNEELAVGGGAHVTKGKLPHESLNFLPIDGTYYGYVKYKGKKLGIEKLGAESEDKKVSDVLVVFCAEQPEIRDFLVVGWYNSATVYRKRIRRPEPRRWVSFKADDATLVAEAERCFSIPRARDNPPSGFGGIGHQNIWYGLSNKAARNNKRVKAFREQLIAYISAPGMDQTPEDVAVEERQRRLSERLERRGNNRRFINTKGYKCEACGWCINEDEREVWGSSFELHHLTPIHELPENDTRVVRAEDFAVLCASCHRAIHRTEFVSDVPSFAEAYLSE